MRDSSLLTDNSSRERRINKWLKNIFLFYVGNTNAVNIQLISEIYIQVKLTRGTGSSDQ